MNVFLCTSRFCSAVGEEGEKDVFNRILVKVVFFAIFGSAKKRGFSCMFSIPGGWDILD